MSLFLHRCQCCTHRTGRPVERASRNGVGGLHNNSVLSTDLLLDTFSAPALFFVVMLQPDGHGPANCDISLLFQTYGAAFMPGRHAQMPLHLQVKAPSNTAIECSENVSCAAYRQHMPDASEHFGTAWQGRLTRAGSRWTQRESDNPCAHSKGAGCCSREGGPIH